MECRGLRIVLAEDAALLREGLVGILERAGHEVVAAVEDADALLAFTARLQPDLVITDIRMPPTHTDEGLRAAAQIRAEHPGIAIMVLSAYVAEAYVPELLDATTVPRRRDRLPAQGPGRPRPRVPRQPRPGRGRRDRRRPGGGPAAARPAPRTTARSASLTDREREVLALMAEGRTNGSIADALVVSEAAVRKHVGNIFAKLDLDPASDRRVSAVLAYLRG